MKRHIKHLLLICLSFISFQTIAKTLITNASQVTGTTNLKVDWGETDVNLSDPSTSLHKFKIVYQVSGGISQTIDNISSSLRSYTITDLSAGTYTVELIEVIRVIVPSTPFSPPYVDTETGSGAMSVSILSLNQAPVAVCNDIVLTAGADCRATYWDYQAGAQSTDPNNDPLTYSLYNEGPYAIGTHGVLLTVTDPGGLSSQCYYEVTVEDNTPPVARAKNAVIFIQESGYATLHVEDIDNGSYDQCQWLSKEVSKSVFTCSDVGNNYVELLLLDESGNRSKQGVNVEVRDNVGPAVYLQTLAVALDANGQANIRQTVENATTDPCGVASITITKENFNRSDVGSQMIEVSAFDNNGVENRQQVWVTVTDPFAGSSIQAFTISSNESTTNESGESTDRAYFPELDTPRHNSVSMGETTLENLLFPILKAELNSTITYGPNPTSDYIRVELSQDLAKNSHIALYNLVGQKQDIPITRYKSFLNVDLRDLKSGLYILNIEDKTTSKAVKIQKL